MSTVKPIELNPIERFYRAHADAVYAFLLSLCRDPIWAEDLMQDTFVKATRSIGGYRGGNPRSWLFSIATQEPETFGEVADRFSSPKALFWSTRTAPMPFWTTWD